MTEGQNRVSLDEPLADYPVVRTSDPGQAVDTLQRVLPRIPIRLQMEDEGALRMLMNAAKIGTITASYVAFGTEVHMTTGVTSAYYVNMPLHGHTLWRAQKMTVVSTPTRAAVLSPGLRGRIIWDRDCAQLSMMVPKESVHRELGRLLGRTVLEPPRFEPVMDLAAPLVCGWLDTLRLVHRQLQTVGAGPLAHPVAAKAFENLVIDGLLLAQRHEYSEELARPADASPPVVRAAIELLEGRPEYPWSVGELAEQVHVSVRALQQAFNRSVGLSPMRYLRNVRLSRVHAELLATPPESVTVSEVATRWAFMHHGHFAAAYRSRYGCNPLDTLRREK
jgi:AraC-like DNA-binding protein